MFNWIVEKYKLAVKLFPNSSLFFKAEDLLFLLIDEVVSNKINKKPQHR